MENRNSHPLKTVLLLSLFGAIALTFVAGCNREKPDLERKELVVLCGSSFPKPMEQLCAEFEAQTGIEFAITIAGSENHLPLIKLGQEGDIFVTHDPYLDYVADANALLGSAHVGFVCPVVAVQPGNPKSVTAIDDLTKPGLKVALSNPEYSTCGEMVFALLEKKGIKDAVMKNVENRLTKGHSDLGTFLKTKTVDAVIMWNGVAHTFHDSLDVVRTPYEYDTEIRVHIIGLSYTKQSESVKKFIDFAQARGPVIFADYGYVK